MKNFAISICLIIFSFSFISCNYFKKSDQVNSNSSVSQNNSTPTNFNKNSQDGCIELVSSEDSSKFISNKIEVIGEIETPLSLTVDSLKKMNVATIENFNVVCQSGANMKVNKTCKGILLKDILEKAKIKQSNHKDRNFYIVARATDNYKATFSWAEIFNNPTGENVFVLFEENGMPIKVKGEMILICKNDIKTGPRHVFWLKSIEINRVD